MEGYSITRAGDTANHGQIPDGTTHQSGSLTTAPQSYEDTPTSPDSVSSGISNFTPSSETLEYEDLDEMMPSVEADVENHVEISSSDDVNTEMRLELRDLVELIKTKHHRLRHGAYVGAADMHYFLERVFHGGWTTRQPYFPPNHRTLRSVVLQTTTKVIRAPTAAKDGSHQQVKLVNKPLLIYILPKPNPREIVTFDFVNENSTPVNIRDPDMLFDVNDFFKAMNEYDMRQFRTVGGYNRAWAVFFARRRLVHWANGNEYSSHPPDEDPNQEIVDLRLCRDCAAAQFLVARVALCEYLRTSEPPFALRMDITIPRSVG